MARGKHHKSESMDPSSEQGLNDNDTGVPGMLNEVLADSYVLMLKTQACHWTAKGPWFFGLHKLTEAQYGELFEAIDVMAERVRSLGAQPPLSMSDMLERATIAELDTVLSTEATVRLLAEDHDTLSAHAQEAADQAEENGDPASHDLLVSRIAAHDKAAWLLRSHLG